MKKIEEYVRSIPDFPEEGIIFRDVTSILQDADGLHLSIDLIQEKLKDVDEVAYVRFASVYREFKDVNTFIEEIGKLLKTQESL